MAQVGRVHMRRQALVAKPTHGHKEHKMLSLLMWLAGLLLSWAISLLKPAFIGRNTLALNPAVNAPNISCFKSPLFPIMPDKNPTA
jgi:hypothetical protein